MREQQQQVIGQKNTQRLIKECECKNQMFHEGVYTEMKYPIKACIYFGPTKKCSYCDNENALNFLIGT